MVSDAVGSNYKLIFSMLKKSRLWRYFKVLLPALHLDKVPYFRHSFSPSLPCVQCSAFNTMFTKVGGTAGRQGDGSQETLTVSDDKKWPICENASCTDNMSAAAASLDKF